MAERGVFVFFEIFLDSSSVFRVDCDFPSLLAFVGGGYFDLFRESINDGVNGFPLFDGQPEGSHFVFERGRCYIVLAVAEIVAALPAVEVVEIVESYLFGPFKEPIDAAGVFVDG